MLLNAAAPASPTTPLHGMPALRSPASQETREGGQPLSAAASLRARPANRRGRAGPRALLSPAPAPPGAPGRERAPDRRAWGTRLWLCAAAAAGQRPDRTGTRTSPAPRSPPPLSPRTRPLLGRGSRGPRPPNGHGGLAGSRSRRARGGSVPPGTGGFGAEPSCHRAAHRQGVRGCKNQQQGKGRDLGWRSPGTPPRCCCCWVLVPGGVEAPTSSTEEMCELTTIHHAPRVLGGEGGGGIRWIPNTPAAAAVTSWKERSKVCDANGSVPVSIQRVNALLSSRHTLRCMFVRLKVRCVRLKRACFKALYFGVERYHRQV